MMPASPDSLPAAVPPEPGRIPRLAGMILSLLLVSVLLWLKLVDMPFMEEQKLAQLLRPIGMAVWPAAVLPWLTFCRHHIRYVAGALGVLVGYRLQGEIFVGFFHGMIYPNTRLYPFLAGALAVGAGLVALAYGRDGTRWRPWVPAASSLCAMGLLLTLTVPIYLEATAPPGTLLARDLRVQATYQLPQVPDGSRLVGRVVGEGFVLCGPGFAFWRLPDGSSRLVDLDTAGDVQIMEAGRRVLMFDKGLGRMYCFRTDTAEIVWSVANLGRSEQVLWMEDAVWLLDYPDQDEWAEGSRAVTLTAVDIPTGTLRRFPVAPPDGKKWPDYDPNAVPPWSGALLAASGDTVFLRLVVVDRPGDTASPWYTYLSVPPGGLRPSWVTIEVPGLMAWDTEPAVVLSGDVAVYISYRNENNEIVALDLDTGRELWSIKTSSSGYGGRPLASTRDRVVVDHGAFMDTVRPDLACYDPRTGEELWRFEKPAHSLSTMVPVGDRTLVITHGTARGAAGMTVTLLDAAGAPSWRYETAGAAYVLALDEKAGTVTLLEAAGQQLPTSGWWGTETVLSLDTGTVLKGGPQGAADSGSFNYIIADGTLYRTAGRRGDDYLKNEAVFRLEGKHVPIYDAERYTDYVLAAPGFVVLASHVEGGTRCHMLVRVP